MFIYCWLSSSNTVSSIKYFKLSRVSLAVNDPAHNFDDKSRDTRLCPSSANNFFLIKQLGLSSTNLVYSIFRESIYDRLHFITRTEIYIFGVKFNFCFYSRGGWRQTDCILKKGRRGFPKLKISRRLGQRFLCLC